MVRCYVLGLIWTLVITGGVELFFFSLFIGGLEGSLLEGSSRDCLVIAFACFYWVFAFFLLIRKLFFKLK